MSVVVFFSFRRTETALKNQEMELSRNKERLQFFKVNVEKSPLERRDCGLTSASGGQWNLNLPFFHPPKQWCSNAFKNVNVVPPDIGAVHQVNLEHLSRVVQVTDGFMYPDSVVGTDSHTTMVNGLGILGWGELLFLL